MPEGGVKLKNLTGYTTYMISVAPFNAAGDGPRSAPTRGRTQQAGTPSPPDTNKYANSSPAVTECDSQGPPQSSNIVKQIFLHVMNT